MQSFATKAGERSSCRFTENWPGEHFRRFFDSLA